MAKKKKSGGSALLARGSMDIPFFLLLITIVTIGLIMLFSASYTYSYYFRPNSLYIFSRQLFFTAGGLLGMYLVSRIRYEYFRLFAIIGTVVSIILLIIVRLLPDSVQPGFYRWINLGFTTFQPSEIAKIGLILILAYLLEKNHRIITGKVPSNMWLAKKASELSSGRFVIYKSFTSTIGYGLLILLFAGLVAIENHVSGTILMLGIGVIMLYLGEVKKGWFIAAACVFVLALVFFILNPDVLKEYAGERIVAWLDKGYKPTGRGGRWQINNSLYAIGSGGLLGTGLGQSKQKHLYVSEPQNDFIFSIVCEELGFVGAAVIIILFALLVYRGIFIGLRAKDRFGGLLAMGISFQIGIQVALNIAVVSDFIPNTGISLPFFSAGGTSVFILLCEMGMLLSVSRSMRRKE